MRFKSSKKDGFQIFAVSGVNTISFAIQATAAARKGLLGFAVERHDVTENEKYFMPGSKVFSSIVPHPDQNTYVSTFNHPVQSFVWDDFTAKEEHEYNYYFYPLRGKPKNLDRSAGPIQIAVTSEPLFSRFEHDIFFNRGVASSQAYSRKFDNKTPQQLEKDISPAKAQEALDWLSRDLDEALLKFIGQAAKGDALLCCFYEFRYEPVARALKKAIADGVDVRLIVDAKVNGKKDKKGRRQPSFPREENLAMIGKAKIPKSRVLLREAKPNDIQHNKFMVLLKGSPRKPTEVWTGSTNISTGGIHGQTNVGHWVRNADAAELFYSYWQLLSDDPGGQANESAADVRRKNAQFRSDVEALIHVPQQLSDIAVGITPVFSPRSGLKVLDLYVDLVDSAKSGAFITLAFGVNKAFKDKLKNNTGANAITFLLLEKKDEPTAKNRETFVTINASNNIYKAWGSYLREPLYQWTKETNPKIMRLNQHVSYIHSKFLLRDPLGDDPIVVTGSANFSDPSTNANDENMIIIRGNRRVADIYFTEFNRLFFHYYFRSVVESIGETGHSNSEGSLFLKENPEEWLVKYQPGKLKQKRVDLFAKMKGFS